ncbi:Glu-tRNA(Gln) amidotransferase subunit GatE [Promethearchaeum syntrophicum]|uniref:Glutamyl-tRNA(Gln) amidotransferase subunit E n=1 Tax=Promethearchaeum syntrophicum TaxID=2594042 RepID=A0A5B9D6U2_9ARCH|nr:Glu-tRNA(Gln) amidotransferase subunit GatE [Candidatus Prometheoarchaeum syntrophicum]QEE14517.1 Glutamyl-tRNA(Gln) amidotransferase subunit E [Candidatus Prometheoarchaeum syntrophicum]
MLDPKELDYQSLGFHAGLEVHHQIKTKRKLFCNCKPEMVKSTTEPDYRFERYFRPVLGEMGDYDPGMLIEYEKGYRCIYHAFEDVDCIYEQDEMPPYWPDEEAILKGYELAHWFDMSAMVDEIIFARKQYLDGSITTGFQRTTIVARDGYTYVNDKKMGITNLTIEEDAARRIKTENYGRTVYYNLDRLGIPLVEVITDHRDCDNPKDLLKLAEIIGLTLRLSGIGRRGIGSARQDVNISIAGGDRVELKGVQDLSLFQKWCSHECLRQDMLIKIAQMLKDRDFDINEVEHTYFELTDKFKAAKIPDDFIVMGIRLPKLDGILGLEIQPKKDFIQDIFEKTALITGLLMKNMFSSDEMNLNSLRKQHKNATDNFFFSNMTKELDKEIKLALNVKNGDAYALVLGSQKWCIHGLKKIIERIKIAPNGVPQETRRALLDGNSEFLRVIHGKDRLYPDTDTPIIDMDMDKVYALKEKVGKRPWEIENEYCEKYGLTFEQLKQLIRTNRLKDFEKLMENGFNPKLVYKILEETLKALQREGIEINKISFENIKEVIKGAQQELYDNSVIPKILKEKVKSSEKSVQQILSDLDIIKIGENELEKMFTDALDEYNKNQLKKNKIKLKEQLFVDLNKQYKINQITGILMRKIKRAHSGKNMNEFVRKHLEDK